MSEQPPSLSQALRGFLAWVLCSVIAVGCLALLWYVMPRFGIDPNSGVNPRERPFAALAMLAIVLLVVMSVFYVSFVVVLLVLRPFVSRAELRAHFVDTMGSGKVLGSLHGWLFERIFRG